MPNSQCSLRGNPKFLQNFGPENNIALRKFLNNIFIQYLPLYFGLASPSKVKKLLFYIISFCVLRQKNFLKLMQNTQVRFVNEAPVA
jgi:hypothetical protein